MLCDCREVTSGLETLASMETVNTRTEGIFVMPESRVSILSTYVHIPAGSSAEEGEGVFLHASSGSSGRLKGCSVQLEELQQRFDAQAAQMQEMRSRKLPG